MRAEITNHIELCLFSGVLALDIPGHSTLAADPRPEAVAVHNLIEEGYDLLEVRAFCAGFEDTLTRRQKARARRAYNAWRRRLARAVTNMVASW